MRLLIAGAGDLGMRVAQLAVRAGHEVVAVRRRPHRDANSPVMIVAGDLAHPAKWLPGLPRCDTLLWCASPEERTERAYRHVYLDAPLEVLDAAEREGWRWRRVVLCSSTAVYGDAREPQDEQSRPAPAAFNGRVLLESEETLRQRQSGALVCARLGGIYGPGRDLQLRKLHSAAPINRDYPRSINRIHVQDATRALSSLCERAAAPPIVNIVDLDSKTEPEVLDSLAEHYGLPKLGRAAFGNSAIGKIILPSELLSLGFRWHFPDHKAWLAVLGK